MKYILKIAILTLIPFFLSGCNSEKESEAEAKPEVIMGKYGCSGTSEQISKCEARKEKLYQRTEDTPSKGY